MLKAIEAEFWIVQFSQVTEYVHVVKYDVCSFYAYDFPSCVSLSEEGPFMNSVTVLRGWEDDKLFVF